MEDELLSSMISVVGLVLVGVSINCIRTGRIDGVRPRITRAENPIEFWIGVFLTTAGGAGTLVMGLAGWLARPHP